MRNSEGVPTIYLCGPIAEPGQPAKGGFQSCNRRTIDALAGNGIDVRTLPYAQPEVRGWRKALEYAVGFTRLALQVLGMKRGSILHLTGLYGPFIQAEVVLIHLAHLRGCRCIYDLRAGSGELHFRQRGAVYRASFTHALRSVDLVMVEGHKLMRFVESLTGHPPVFFPNHIDTGSMPDRPMPASLPAAPVVGYAGSLNPEKGIRTILEACRQLAADGLDPDVRLAGVGPAGFVDDLRRSFADLRITWLGAVPSDRVLALFGASHFFVFPTSHRGEGQSNALTEAMACGCVAVVSDHGFNASVVGDCGAVLAPSSSGQDYAKAIRDIWEGDRWKALSQASQQRIRQQFSSAAVVAELIQQYRTLGSAP